MKTILATAAMLAAIAATPALAQQEHYPSDAQPSPRSQSDQQMDQQAQTPDQRSQPGQIETLKQEHMSSPNVTGESIQESPYTGIPHPENQPGQQPQESVPRP